MLVSVRHAAFARPALYLMWGVVFFSIISAISYFAKFWHKVDESVKNRRRRELLTLERKRQRVQRHQRGRGGSSGAEGGLAGTIWKPPEVN